MNKPDSELEVYKEMITAFPDNHMNIWSVASKYVAKKEYRKSIPYFTKAIQVCVKNEPIDNNLSHMEYSSQPCNMYYRQRAETNIKLNNISDAIDDYYELCTFNTIQKNGKPRPIKDCSKLDSLKKAKALGDNWTYYFETDSAQFYYDKSRINKNGKNKLKVWVMSVKSPDVAISERTSSNLSVLQVRA